MCIRDRVKVEGFDVEILFNGGYEVEVVRVNECGKDIWVIEKEILRQLIEGERVDQLPRYIKRVVLIALEKFHEKAFFDLLEYYEKAL